MWRQLALLVAAFVAGTAIAELLGAVNMGVALGVGQIAFAGVLVWVMLTDAGREERSR